MAADFEQLLATVRPGQTLRIREALDKIQGQSAEATKSKEEDVAIALMDWARSKSTKEIFVKEVLNEMLDMANKMGYINVGNHALCSFFMGYKKAIEDLKEKLMNWQTGQAFTEAPEGENNG